MHEVAWGRDERPVVTESEPVSMSRETTFERDLHAVRDRAELGAIFTHLCEKVAEDLQRKGYVGKTIGIKLRYGDFKIPPGRWTLPQAGTAGTAAAPAGRARRDPGQGGQSRGAAGAGGRRIRGAIAHGDRACNNGFALLDLQVDRPGVPPHPNPSCPGQSRHGTHRI
jgi:hypothetical protein